MLQFSTRAIASGVSIAIVATIVGLGANVKSLYTTVASLYHRRRNAKLMFLSGA